MPRWLLVIFSPSALSLAPRAPPPVLLLPSFESNHRLSCYGAWSIPCYHREINYLDQAAGERGNNERMLLLPRQWPRSLNMNLSLAEDIYGSQSGARPGSRSFSSMNATSSVPEMFTRYFNALIVSLTMQKFQPDNTESELDEMSPLTSERHTGR